MDETEQYIYMCQKAVEIQALWEPTLGDFVASEWLMKRTAIILFKDTTTKGIERYVSYDSLTRYFCKDEYIWLPRQDQLQDILLSDPKSFITPEDLLMGLYSYTLKNNEDKYGGELAASMEQLWLAFVMHEKFKKKWNGKDWEEVGE